MWNNQYSSPRYQYNYYTARKQEDLIKYNKYKMLIMLLSNLTHRYMKDCLSQIRRVTSHDYRIIVRMNNIAFSNAHICTKFSF